ncbi:DEAD/DEAH box helicase [Nitratidesulfovibrio liaohensis]|uniref:DEAD/DEAH box helicase n=1 Tax=Nitratidesulfovibrio liaohensis TaxID=2604158 RepID=A0ABY9R6E3_9BACT|nr:DEAD/DEAH box helicase [Nitratidesulfovibrio liaohensis]WMW67311.1 DEAD/DEAH box helicase [Nitratidesulfovibrio liaohensis]
MPHAPDDSSLTSESGTPDIAASSRPNTSDAPPAPPASFRHDADNPVRDYITALLGSPFGRQVTHHRALPAREADHAPNRRPWPKAIRDILARNSIDDLYTHQARATDLIRAGRHVVVATPTASGKTYVYNLPVLERFLSDPDARALYLFPLKALAQDQLSTFNGLTAAWPEEARPRAAIYDGDTTDHFRRKIRQNPPTVLLTNPEMLHLAILPHHQQWTSLLASLAFIVVDEVHTYRGVLGAHMAQVFRRLLRVCARYGAHPTFVFCSATVGNPGELAANLTGLGGNFENRSLNVGEGTLSERVPFPHTPIPPKFSIGGNESASLGAGAGEARTGSAERVKGAMLPCPSRWASAQREPYGWGQQSCGGAGGSAPCSNSAASSIDVITESGAPQGLRHFVFVNPDDSPSTAAIQLLRAALARDLRTIVYCQSRRMTELISMWAAEKAGPYRDRISAYRAGFLPEERRDIEARMAGGDLLAVISTSALELGIDIGGLDLCILVGYPGTVMSTLQRGGRVGRAQQESAVVLVAGEDALDQYFVRHPNEFFDRPAEHAVVNPDNSVIAKRHIECAAAELPLPADEPWLAAPGAATALAELEAEGLVLRSADGTTLLAARKRPHRHVDLRGSGNTFTIEDGDGTIIGSVDGHRAYRETHPGAVYLHRGRSWVITRLDPGAQKVVAEQARVSWFTRVRANKTTEILDIHDQCVACGTRVFLGKLRVTETITGYEKRSVSGQRLLSVVPLDAPPFVFETEGLWFEIPDAARIATENELLHFMGAIHALEHAAIGILPLLVMTDRNDLGGISTPMHAQVGRPAVFIYDGLPGGAGLTRAAFADADALFRATRAAIAECPCETGCPSCVHSPKCGSGNRPIDKSGALFLLDRMACGTPESDPVQPGLEQEGRQGEERNIFEEEAGVGNRGAAPDPAGGHMRAAVAIRNARDARITAAAPQTPFLRPGNDARSGHHHPDETTRHDFQYMEEGGTRYRPMPTGHTGAERTAPSRPDSDPRPTQGPTTAHSPKEHPMTTSPRDAGPLLASPAAGKTDGRIVAPVGRYMVLDVETRRAAADVGGWHRADRMGVSVAVLYDAADDSYTPYEQDAVPEMLDRLRAADLVVGFNISRFDYAVLSPFAPYDLQTLPTPDMLTKVKDRLSYRISLDNLAQATFGTPKSADGLQALQWWKEQRLDLITEYCRKDVEITRALFLHGREKGYLLFTNKAGQAVRVPVAW